MRFRRLKAIALKELLQIWRDPRSLMIALLMPFTQMFLLGYGVTLDLKHIPICTFDREASQNSQALLKHFEASSYFAIARNVQAYPALEQNPPDVGQRL
jgi:ABC-2 type transport system permease protein